MTGFTGSAIFLTSTLISVHLPTLMEGCPSAWFTLKSVFISLPKKAILLNPRTATLYPPVTQFGLSLAKVFVVKKKPLWEHDLVGSLILLAFKPPLTPAVRPGEERQPAGAEGTEEGYTARWQLLGKMPWPSLGWELGELNTGTEASCWASIWALSFTSQNLSQGTLVP